MVSSGTGISDRMAMLRSMAQMAVDMSIPYEARIMPICSCHSIVKEFLEKEEDELLDDSEYMFAVSLMNELADQASLQGGESDDNFEV